MSRILVDGAYDHGSDNFVLRREGGDVYMVIHPDDVFGIGNSIGGYWAKPILYGKEKMLSLVRVSGSERRLPPEALRQIHGRERGFLLRPMRGLWATSSGSALRGVFHRIRDLEDPIEAALRSIGMPSNLVIDVEAIDVEAYDGGSLCRHSTGRGTWYKYEGDGKASHVREGTHVEAHDNQYHVGCMASPAVVRVQGGTWLVTSVKSLCMNGCPRTDILRVYVTPAANREAVASFIRGCVA